MIVFPLSIQCALSTGSTLTVCMLSAYGLFPWLGPVCLWRERENPADATSPPFTPSFVKLPPGAAAKNVSILSALHEGQHMNPALMEKDPTACVSLHERKKWWERRFVFGVDRKEDQTVGKATPLVLTLTQQSVNELVGLVWHLGGVTCVYIARDVAEIDVISFSVTTSGFEKQAKRPGAFRRAGYRLRGDSSLGTYLDSFASIWINSLTSPRIGVATASGSTRPTPGCPLGFGLMKDRARWVRKMRSVSPRMRNMRGMGAGMKWTQWTELNGAGWEGLASPWMDEIEWEMGGWVEKKRARGKGPDCMGCVQQQKKRVERPNSIQWRRRMGRDKNTGCSAGTSSWQQICSKNTVTTSLSV